MAFSHSVFALPFALAAFLMGHHLNRLSNVSQFDLRGSDRSWSETLGPIPIGSGMSYTVALIVVAVLALRTAAMSFNRLVDADIDSRNPRTAGREIPSGVVTTGEARLLVGLSIALFMSCLLYTSRCV